MPPALSEDESDSDVPNEIPAKPVADVMDTAEDGEEDDNDDEEDDEVYFVEAIQAHRFFKGKLQYQVKWLGYPDPEDLTWEPLENLKTAALKLREYHESIGGPPEPPKKGSSKKAAVKRIASAALDSPAPLAKKPRALTNGSAVKPDPLPNLPKGTWENDISNIISIIEEEDKSTTRDAKDKKPLMVYAQWKNGEKRKHHLKTLRTKAPQHLLDYYESHLKFGA